MARRKNEVNDELVKKLIDAVYKTYGKPLTYSFECELLSKEIEKVTSTPISPQTLRRLLGFLDADFFPSAKTLNNLSAYAGFENFYKFSQQLTKPTFEPLTIKEEVSLYLDFYNLDIKPEADMNYHNAARAIALRIVKNPFLLSTISPALARNKVSRIYFFERFPFIDGLCSDYKRSLEFYLKSKDGESQIFGNSLLLLSAFLSQNHNELKSYIKHINKYQVNDKMHPFLIARYVGSNILYNYVTNGNISLWIYEAYKWNNFFLPKAGISFWRFPYFQYMICDYLNIIGNYEVSYSIIRTINQMSRNYEIEAGYKEGLDIIYKIANHTSDKDKFSKWFETTVAFNSIHPLFINYYELQTLCVYYSINNNGKKLDKVKTRIESLITKTGFSYFSKYLQ